MLKTDCAVPENIHTPPTEVFLSCTPVPLGNCSLASYFASKILTLKTPLPLGISDDLPWDGYGFLLELHIIHVVYSSSEKLFHILLAVL